MGAGGQTLGYRTKGKPPATMTAKQRASRKKPPEGHRCADRRESPIRGVPYGAAERPPQEPDKGNPP